MTPEETAWIEKLEKNIDRHWDDLNSFEKKFMEDLIERFHRYGEGTHVTTKQWAVITTVSEKIL